MEVSVSRREGQGRSKFAGTLGCCVWPCWVSDTRHIYFVFVKAKILYLFIIMSYWFSILQVKKFLLFCGNFNGHLFSSVIMYTSLKMSILLYGFLFLPFGEGGFWFWGCPNTWHLTLDRARQQFITWNCILCIFQGRRVLRAHQGFHSGIEWTGMGCEARLCGIKRVEWSLVSTRG